MAIWIHFMGNGSFIWPSLIFPWHVKCCKVYPITPLRSPRTMCTTVQKRFTPILSVLSPFHRNSKSGLVCHFLVPAYHLFNIILFHHFLYHFLVHPISPKLHPGFLSLSRSFYHPGKGDRKSEKKRADMVHSYHPGHIWWVIGRYEKVIKYFNSYEKVIYRIIRSITFNSYEKVIAFLGDFWSLMSRIEASRT